MITISSGAMMAIKVHDPSKKAQAKGKKASRSAWDGACIRNSRV